MKIKELLTEKYLYHATFSKNVPSIIKKGLQQFQTSNWTKGGERYNQEAGLFSFEHPEDVINWAGKMEYDFQNNISIVRLNVVDQWHQDPSGDVNLAGGKGKTLRTQKNVDPSDIVDVFHMDDFGKPGPLGISRDEWIRDVSTKLEN